MKKLALVAAVCTLATPALADPIHGVWKTIADDNGVVGHVTISNCGSKICGIATGSFKGGKKYPSENIGKKIIWDMTAQGGGAYAGGKIWAPDRDKTYKSKLQLNGNTLNVKGCIGPICRDGGTWTRVN